EIRRRQSEFPREVGDRHRLVGAEQTGDAPACEDGSTTERTAAIRDSRYSCPRFLGHRRNQLGNSPLSSLWRFRTVDRAHMLALEAKGQAIKGQPGFGVVSQSSGEVRRRSDDPRRGIKL